MKILSPQVRRWLIQRADNYQQNLKILICGFISCFCGVLIVAGSEFMLGGGMLAELIALLGLILVAAGIILAAFGYICLSLLRLFRFFNDDRPHD
ncbi:hypothetical protein [Marinobacterium jannaschii]|uniref:hypothetical protein n=1 Tax=Marinobacterium jannaschii TaxID=64970 RepID=UPI00047F801F|nr:hypothetical protein [Marinobacterium jannaschii]